MALKLKSLRECPPGGFIYRQPESGWELNTWDYQELCDEVQKHRRANPQLKLMTDMASIQSEVHSANVARVAAIPGAAAHYLIEGDIPPPKTMAQPRNLGQKLRNVAGGTRTIVDWIKSGAEAVPHELANKRAAVCVSCPLNNSKDITSFFTAPVSAAIQAALNQRKDWKLETEFDDRLNVCSGCLCPMKLKVFMPLETILKHMPEDVKARLDSRCWILKLDK